MRDNLNGLLAERGMSAAVVMGAGTNNPDMFYLTQGVPLTYAVIVLAAGRPAVLYHYDAERTLAAETGLVTASLDTLEPGRLTREASSALGGRIRLFQAILSAEAIEGCVGLYGRIDANLVVALVDGLRAACSQIEFVGDFERPIFAAARSTKDRHEIERIRRVGRATEDVVRQTVEYVRQHPLVDDTFMTSNGPLTVADVKGFIRRALSVCGLEDPKGTIFALGREAGIPHAFGTPEDPVRAGAAVVFDIYPREIGGGYFWDMTRTFAFGWASEDLAALYDEVLTGFHAVEAELSARDLLDMPAGELERLARDFFAARGHTSYRTHPGALSGYLHPLGHGVGLDIHERPALQDHLPEAAQDRLQPGSLFSVEPGLYYPERAMGVRLEDLFTIDEAGRAINLSTFPKDLVVPL